METGLIYEASTGVGGADIRGFCRDHVGSLSKAYEAVDHSEFEPRLVWPGMSVALRFWRFGVYNQGSKSTQLWSIYGICLRNRTYMGVSKKLGGPFL